MKCDNKVIKVSNPGTWETWDLGPTKDNFTFYILPNPGLYLMSVLVTLSVSQ